ncbi:MAG: hypothetical protein ACRD3V_05675 [Vicinamibacteria bacterium]
MTERRELFKLLLAAGILGPSATGESQDAPGLTTEVLEKAAALFEAGLEPSRIKELLPSVQRNVDFFRIVRELEIGDDVEPAVLFKANRRAGG